MTINEAFSPGYRLAIIATDERCESCEVTVGSDEIGAIFLHRLIGGFNSPLRSFATSDESGGSPPSQSLQRNLRPPVLTNINRMGLRHLWQIGGGAFLGMKLTLDQADRRCRAQSGDKIDLSFENFTRLSASRHSRKVNLEIVSRVPDGENEKKSLNDNPGFQRFGASWLATRSKMSCLQPCHQTSSTPCVEISSTSNWG